MESAILQFGITTICLAFVVATWWIHRENSTYRMHHKLLRKAIMDVFIEKAEYYKACRKAGIKKATLLPAERISELQIIELLCSTDEYKSL